MGYYNYWYLVPWYVISSADMQNCKDARDANLSLLPYPRLVVRPDPPPTPSKLSKQGPTVVTVEVMRRHAAPPCSSRCRSPRVGQIPRRNRLSGDEEPKYVQQRAKVEPQQRAQTFSQQGRAETGVHEVLHYCEEPRGALGQRGGHGLPLEVLDGTGKPLRDQLLDIPPLLVRAGGARQQRLSALHNPCFDFFHLVLWVLRPHVMYRLALPKQS